MQIDRSICQQLLSAHEFASDATMVQIEPLYLANEQILSTQFAVTDSFVDTASRQQSPCNLCLSTYRPRGMWICCGITACLECITNQYLFDSRFVCPWCRFIFPKTWELKSIIMSPVNAFAEAPWKERSNSLQRHLAAQGISKNDALPTATKFYDFSF